MSPDEARRLAAVYLIPEHPAVEVGEAVSAVARTWEDPAPRPPYDVTVSIDGKPGRVHVTGHLAHQVTLAELDGVTTCRALVKWAEPAT